MIVAAAAAALRVALVWLVEGEISKYGRKEEEENKERTVLWIGGSFKLELIWFYFTYKRGCRLLKGDCRGVCRVLVTH